ERRDGAAVHYRGCLKTLLSGKSRMASGHYRQSFRACTAPEGRPESPATVISANFGLAAAGPGNSEKCRPGAHCEGSARAYRHELRMRDVRMPSPIYRKLEKEIIQQYAVPSV